MFSSRKSSAPASGATTGIRSLRLRSSASAYLNRTPSVASNQTTWTWSAWVKRGNITSGFNTFFSAGDNLFQVRFDQTTDDLQIYNYVSSSYQLQLVTTQVFRDPSAWYHIVIAIDTTQATSTNRAKLYVNGSQVTSFSTATYPAQNTNLIVNSVIGHYFGINHGYGSYYDGYLADLYLIDGQQLTPSSFASTNATTGQWSPAIYSGSYGTNGFHLTFANTTSTTTLGYDTSGNSNNWTTNNISLTAGSTYDSMNDVPVAYSATAANYCVMNPNQKGSTVNIANGNLGVSNTTSGGSGKILGTIGVSSGKWYAEATMSGSGGMPGISEFIANTSQYPGGDANSWGYNNGGDKYYNGGNAAYGASFTTGDVIGVALNMDTGSVTFYKNNTSQGVAYNSGIAGKTITFAGRGDTTTTESWNFGQQPFTYTPPSGYNALNTYNLPTPTIAQGNKYMDATLYTGTLVAQSITNAGSFKPDLVWIKSRSASTDNKLTDSVRGVTKALVSNSTAAETTDTLGMTSFNSGGFTVSTDTNYNNSGATYVGWQWQAGAGSSSSNTSGTITSTVSASTTAGFSIVTYTGTGSNATVGHGIGVAPSMVIVKNRTSGSGDVWLVQHASLGPTKYIILNRTDAVGTASTPWNNTAPTSSVFSIGTLADLNTSTNIYVAYCFAPIAGFSAFGSYTGNGSTSGPFIYCGFQPKFIMTKRTNTTGDWFIWDSARNTYNSLTLALYPDLNNAEYNYGAVWNFTSNGFYPVSNSVIANNSGDTYIYMAFASNPFKYANAF